MIDHKGFKRNCFEKSKIKVFLIKINVEKVQIQRGEKYQFDEDKKALYIETKTQKL